MTAPGAPPHAPSESGEDPGLVTSFPATRLLIGAIVAAYAIQWLFGGADETRALVRLGANFRPLVLQGEWQRLLTAMLLHGGLLHLVLNAWALFQLGRLCEVVLGSGATLGLFVTTGLAGSALSLLDARLSVGASGAIFGIEGALVAHFLRHRDRLTPEGGLMLRQLVGWSAVMLLFGFVTPGIDWRAHLGGFLSGGGLGALFRPQPPGHRSPLLGAWAAASLALLVGAVGLQAGTLVPVERVSVLHGVAVTAARLYRVEDTDEGLVLADPLGVQVHVRQVPGPDAKELVTRELASDGATDGPAASPALSEPRPGAARRAFVWARPSGELAGFVEARCEAGACVVVTAIAPGARYPRYLPELEAIAASARRTGPPLAP